MSIDQRVASLQQVRILRVVLDHVAQLAEVMHQQPQASLILVGIRRFEDFSDQVLELGLLDFERYLQRLLQSQPGMRAIRESRMQLPQPHDSRIVERNRTRLLQLALQLQYRGDQSQRTDVASLVARHAEPEIVQLEIAG